MTKTLPRRWGALENANAVDLDARSQEWRSGGWEYAAQPDGVQDSDEDVSYGSRDASFGGAGYRSYVPDRR